MAHLSAKHTTLHGLCMGFFLSQKTNSLFCFWQRIHFAARTMLASTAWDASFGEGTTSACARMVALRRPLLEFAWSSVPGFIWGCGTSHVSTLDCDIPLCDVLRFGVLDGVGFEAPAGCAMMLFGVRTINASPRHMACVESQHSRMAGTVPLSSRQVNSLVMADWL